MRPWPIVFALLVLTGCGGAATPAPSAVAQGERLPPTQTIAPATPSPPPTAQATPFSGQDLTDRRADVLPANDLIALLAQAEGVPVDSPAGMKIKLIFTLLSVSYPSTRDQIAAATLDAAATLKAHGKDASVRRIMAALQKEANDQGGRSSIGYPEALAAWTARELAR